VYAVEGVVKDKGGGGGDGVKCPNDWAGGYGVFVNFGDGGESGDGRGGDAKVV
jgi:hypothetical protein